MSSIMRWRSALTVSVVIGDSCLWLRWIDTSILKTGDLARYRRSLLVDSARAPPRRRLSRSDLDAMGRAARQWHHRRCNQPMERPMPQPNDLSRSLVTLEQDSTLIAVIEMGQSSWLVAGIVPGIERQPLKKLAADQDGLLQLLHRWRKEAAQAGHPIKRIAVAYEAGRDGFWLARWLRARRHARRRIAAPQMAIETHFAARISLL